VRHEARPEPFAGREIPEDRDALYAEFRPLVQRLIRQYGSEPEMRQDLEGEIYCQFTRLLDVYDTSRGVPLRPYIVRQLTASIYTYARCHWRRQRREFSLELWDGAAQSADPSDQWDHDLMIQRIRTSLPQAVSRLPQRQRNVVIWRYYEERSFEDIAQLLGVQIATARSLLRHGLNNLRKHMHSDTTLAD
jgi:RNA polymerase sigma-70 factor (ECF subfamily)